MNTIKIEGGADKRTAIEAARAAPVSLPAGSYDHEALSAAIDASSLAKNDDKREEMRAAAVDEINETPVAIASAGLEPGYVRVTAVDDALGTEESRIVFDAKNAAKAEAPPATTDAAPAAAKKGE